MKESLPNQFSQLDEKKTSGKILLVFYSHLMRLLLLEKLLGNKPSEKIKDLNANLDILYHENSKMMNLFRYYQFWTGNLFVF